MKRRTHAPGRRRGGRGAGALTGVLPLGWTPPSETELHPDEDARRLEDLIAADAELDLEADARGRALERADAINDHGYRRPTAMTEHRDPYVGEGADGARRSAQIDREEAETLPTPTQNGYTDRVAQHHAALLASADRWDRQARELER